MVTSTIERKFFEKVLLSYLQNKSQGNLEAKYRSFLQISNWTYLGIFLRYAQHITKWLISDSNDEQRFF